MYSQLVQINQKPRPFEFYTTELMWNTPHISARMLAYHLNDNLDMASRNRPFIERSVDWIADHFGVGAQTRICDLGCGPGLYTSRLAQTGAMLTGVDFSQSSIAYARQTAQSARLPIRYVQGNYLEYETQDRYDLILMIMGDFCVLSPSQRCQLLENCRRMLNTGGAFLFDGYLLNAFEKKSESAIYQHCLMDGFWSQEDYYGFLNVYKYPAEKLTLDQYTIVEPQRTWQVHNWLQYYDLDSLSATLHDCGFAIAELFSDVCGSEYNAENDEFAVVVKPL